MATRRIHRTEDEILMDYVKVVALLNTPDTTLHEDTRREILYKLVEIYSGRRGYLSNLSNTWITEDAIPFLDEHGNPRGDKTIKEHVVPISLMVDALLRAGPVDEGGLKQILDQGRTVCIVTTEEDGRLNAHHRSRMPEGTVDFKTELWARYDSAGISQRYPLLDLLEIRRKP